MLVPMAACVKRIYCHREYRFFFASLNELTVFPYYVIQSCLSVSLLGGGVVFAYLQQSEEEMCILFLTGE